MPHLRQAHAEPIHRRLQLPDPLRGPRHLHALLDHHRQLPLARLQVQAQTPLQLQQRGGVLHLLVAVLVEVLLGVLVGVPQGMGRLRLPVRRAVRMPSLPAPVPRPRPPCRALRCHDFIVAVQLVAAQGRQRSRRRCRRGLRPPWRAVLRWPWAPDPPTPRARTALVPLVPRAGGGTRCRGRGVAPRGITCH